MRRTWILTLLRGRWCRGRDDVMRIKYSWNWCGGGVAERHVDFGIGIVVCVAVV